jgi:type IV secretion system protein VirB9
MRIKTMLAVSVGLSIILCSCTTTKDLERHPEMVAVEGSKGEVKESTAGQSQNGESRQERVGASIDAAGKTESETLARTTDGARESNTRTNVTESVEAKNAENAAASVATAPAKEGAVIPPVVIEKKIYIEKPIYYPETVPQAFPKPGETVANANSQGVMKPKDYNGAMILYDYDEKLVYQVFTMPLRVTDIYLEPGEKVIEQPFCGDTTRWSIGGGVSKTLGVDTQHLYLKPSEEGLETTLIVNTDRRIYHLIIKSFKETFMLAVMWRYPGFGLPYDFLSQDNQKKNGIDPGKKQVGNQAESNVTDFAVDLALMSTDYTVSYPKNNPPDWLPSMVLDDGNKTYIVLPEAVIHHELPAVFGENGELLNFRVKDNIFVLDRLVRKVQLKLRDITVEVKKKGA